LLDSWPELELLVVSKPRPGGETERLLAELGLEGRVRFVSGISTEQMVEYYAEASIAVVPSVYEGFGLPAAEAMACGVPLVSTDGGALPEVVGAAAMVVPTQSPDALAQAIDSLLRDPQRRASLGQAGRERILENFSWERCAQRMSDYYAEMLARADS